MSFNLELTNDDFWDETSGNKFHFEDDDFSSEELFQVDDQEFLMSSTNVSSIIPLHSITSKENLHIFLDDIKLPSKNSNSVDKTVENMFFSYHFQLFDFKNIEDKLDLLEKSIRTNDGNIILYVVLFLFKTLKPSFVYRYLSEHPVAAAQYTNYLKALNKLHDLDITYSATNQKNNLSQLYYISTMNSSFDGQLTKLKKFYCEHLQDIADSYEKTIFENNQSFLESNLAKTGKVISPSIAFANLCIQNNSLSELRARGKNLKLSEYKTDWILLNVYASNKQWQSIKEMFQKPSWYSKRSLITSHLKSEIVAYCLYKHKAPENVIVDHLKMITDMEKSLYLAKKYHCPSFVVQSLIAKRDRQGILEYRAKVSSNSELTKRIDSFLSTEKS